MFCLNLPNSTRIAVVDDEDADIARAFAWRSLEPHAGYQYVVAKDSTGSTVYLHRLVARATRGTCVDHIDGDTLNNRRANLRVCTHAENMRNRRRSHASKFPYKGISQRRPGGPFRAVIRCNGRVFRFGPFKTAKDAAIAYDEAAIRLHGDFARLNFPARKKINPKPINNPSQFP